MIWRLELSARALKDLERLDVQARGRIMRALRRYVETEQGNVKRLTGQPDLWRLRVGDWRVLFEYRFEVRVLFVQRIRHRSEAYK